MTTHRKHNDEWLNLPDEDIVHLTNGEVWYDPDGRFTAVRDALLQLLSLNRYGCVALPTGVGTSSGMGTYAVKRAILRNNEYFAAVAFARSIKLGLQMAFMLEKQYYPYDKWIMAFFKDLPRLYEPLHPIVDEAVKLSTSWERKYELLNQMADVLDQTMVADGIIKPHSRFAGSPTSGYRIMENAYQEILQKLPADILGTIPLWDQIYLEKHVSAWVASIDQDTWHGALNLNPIED